MRRASLVELPLLPGALSDDTELVAKLRATDMDKVRARGNRWETIKAWEAFNASGMSAGTARGVYQWSTLTGLPAVLAASESAVNAWINGSRLDVTPKWADVYLDPLLALAWESGTNPTITCTWSIHNPVTEEATTTPHFLQVGDVVTFSGITGTSGDTITFNLNASHTITAVPTPTTFEFVATGTSSGVGVGFLFNASPAFTATVAFRNGLATGTGDAIVSRPRIPSIDNFGENAVFCGSDGTPVFYWQPSTSYPELVDVDDFGESGVPGANWTESSGTLTHAGASEDVTENTEIVSLMTPGKTYELTFTLSSFGAGDSFGVSFRSGSDETEILIPIYPTVNPNSPDNANITYSGRFVMPAGMDYMVLEGSGSFSVSNLSVKLLSIAHPIAEAPQINNALFVDGNHVLHVLGSVEADGDYNPALHRWCDQDNYREWIPDTDNIAGEQTLGKGTTAVCGAPVGDANLLLSDDGAFISSFTTNGYNLRQIGQGCGCVGARALAVHNGRAFWPSATGLFAFDGAQVLGIECPLKDRYVGALAQYQETKTYSWLNTEYGELWIHYPHTDDGTEVSRYMIFNFVEKGNPWSFGTLNRTTMARAGTFHYPIGIDASGNIWKHETGTAFTGSGIVLPFVETGYVTSEDGDHWMGCSRYFPDIKDQVGNIEFTVIAKRTPQGENNTQTIGPLTLIPDQDKLDFLIPGRQFKFRWRSPSSTTGWRLGVVGLWIVPKRERR
jgi:hypothetical protein